MPRRPYDPERDHVDTPTYRGPCRRQEGPLGEMREELSRLTSAFKEGTHDVLELVKKHNETLYGNGRPGLTTRLDRLEQAEGRRSRGVWVVAAAVVGVIVKLAVEAWAR
jgi:hypothetical protein